MRGQVRVAAYGRTWRRIRLKLWCAGNRGCCLNKGLGISIRNEDAGLVVSDMHLCCCIIISDDRQTAGHGFECDIAKGFGVAGKKEYVG